MLKLKPNCLLSVRIKDEFVQKSNMISVSFGRKPFDETRILSASLEVLARVLLLCLERIPHHVRKSQDEIEVDEPACYFPTWQDR
jgi:hypothetical protein